MRILTDILTPMITSMFWDCNKSVSLGSLKILDRLNKITFILPLNETNLFDSDRKIQVTQENKSEENKNNSRKIVI